MAKIILNFIATKNEKIGTFLLKKKFGGNNIYEQILESNVFINKNIVKGKNEFVKPGDRVKVILNDEVNNLTVSEKEIDIVYEDEYILIVNKPYDLDVEPSRFTEINNLASRVSYYYSVNDIKSKIHIVNRLDKLTRGLVIFAKNRYIKNLFINTNIVKKYECLVEGKTNDFGSVFINIRKDENGSKRVCSEDGKPCLTTYTRINFSEGLSLLDVRTFSGRTHQIRVSMESIGHPLINDPLYGKESGGEMYLNAYFLKFIHPITNELIVINLKK